MLVLSAGVSALPQTQGGVDILLANARSLEARGRIDLAAQNWRKVLLVDPNQTEALAGLARGAKENGQTDEERSWLDRLRKINPRDPQIAAVEKLRVFTPEERSRLDEAGRLAMQHKPDQAMQIYREVLGDQPPPLGKWAQHYYETEAASTGGRETAIAQLRRLAAQNPKQEAYRLWLATVLSYDSKTRTEGFQLFESIKDPAMSEQARAPWRQALLWDKQNPDALGPMEAYLQRYPDQELQPFVAALREKQQQDAVAADRQEGFKALQGQHAEAAAERFTEVLRQSPNDVNAIVGLGFARLDEKRFSEAQSLFDRARSLAPQRQDARDGYNSASFSLALQRGAAAQQRKDSASAVQAYQEALTLQPSDQGALLGLANALLDQHKFAEAETRFQQVLSRSPSNSEALAGLGFLRLNQGRFDDAAKLFAQAHRLEPARADVSQGYRNAKFWGIMNQAAAALNQDQPKAAVAAYQQAVLLNPNDKDALHGLANAFMRAGDYAGASRIYTQLTAAYPTDESNWLQLMQAQIRAQDPKSAIATTKRIPPPVKLRIEQRSDFYSELALLYYQTDQPAAGDQALQRALQLARTSDTPDALSLRFQIASAFMDQGKMGQAIEIYRQATQAHPENPSGWEALVGAYIRGSDFSDAAAAVRSMPQTSWEEAVKNTGFLNSVALIDSSRGDCSAAEQLLRRSITLDRTTGHLPSESTQLQLADVLMRQRLYDSAENVYYDIVSRGVASPDAWRGYLAVLHRRRADSTLVSELPHMPAAVRAQLEKDPTFLILEASAYSTLRRNQDALPLLLKARSGYAAQHKPTPINLDIQTAWTMLAVSPEEPGLSDLLTDARSRTRLTSTQREAIQELWSLWSIRRAEDMFNTKPQLALSILTDAARQYPRDRNVHAALASLYLKRHDKQAALEVFENWGMNGAQADDYRMAAGAALAAHKNQLANRFLQQGLQRFPTDPGLMHMKARQDIARGDYDEGERELRSALTALNEEGASTPETKAAASSLDQQQSAAPLAVQDDSAAEPGAPQSAPSCSSQSSAGSLGGGSIRPIALTFVVPRGFIQQQNPVGQDANSQVSSPPAQVQKQQQQQQMQEEVEAVDDRNTPLTDVGGLGAGRIGDPGIDQLIVGESILSGAYTASNQVRLGIEANGVYAYSGTPDGSSKLKYGTLPAGAAFAQQDQFGYGGSAQLSTNTFGIMAGVSPQNFPVHNIIGGIRYRPFNGPLTFLGLRDSVKDSLLSWAGARDPGTGIRWGGVISNTGAVKFDTNPVNGSIYRRFGAYGSGSYSLLQGRNVPDNWSMVGNAGFYWQMIQGLAVGGNASAMHYDRNLKYFSFGQGGYFSPQEYYLASIPISWYARHPRFEYQVKFSGGVQYLHEASTLYYPVLPGTTRVLQGRYAANNGAAANYDAEIRLGYRMTPYLYFDTFATANNSENYYSQSVGFNLKFMLDPIPTRTDLRINSIPDWTGKQPFAIQ
ncbi:MAG TPA: cellulose synthase subunit BcsC-related outer membrane protein [Acidobacteriaceae bacterium]|nr:cellulose synthase subunit BcsC-related outer membrane protein [Acidobacteriaceae bacterium]